MGARGVSCHRGRDLQSPPRRHKQARNFLTHRAAGVLGAPRLDVKQPPDSCWQPAAVTASSRGLLHVPPWYVLDGKPDGASAERLGRPPRTW